MVHGFGAFVVGGHGTGGLDHGPELFGVLKHGAGTEHIVIEGLVVVVGHEQGRAQGIQQGSVVDVAVGVMDEHTGLHIALGVDVQIVPAAGDAAVDVLGVVLEVDGEDGLVGAVFPDLMVDVGALLRAGQKLGCCVVAHGHIVEEPGEQCTGIDHVIEEPLAGDVLVVDRGIAGGDAEGQTMLLQQAHGVCYLLIDALAPAGVVGLLEALQRDGGDEVFDPEHFLTEGFINQGAIGEGQEGAVGMHLAELEEVSLAHRGLAAGVDVHIGAQLLALADDGVDGLQGEVQPVAVLRSPAAGTVEVAGGGGVEQDGPGDVAAVFLLHLVLGRAALEAGVEQEILEEGLPDAGVQLIELQHQPVPVVLLGDGGADGLSLLHIPVIGGELVHHIHQLGQVLIGVALDVLQGLIDRKGLHGFFQGTHKYSAFLWFIRP